MLYVERDENGKIIGLHTSPKPNAVEQKPLGDMEVFEFMSQNMGKDAVKQLLSISDTGVIRIVEDLINLLIKKNIIHFTELPEEAQKKIIERVRVREKLVPQNLMVDDIL